MLKRLNNITQNERKNKGVVALADRPNVVSAFGKSGLSPLELKVWFDKLGNLLADKINEIHNALNESGQDYIGIGNLGDEVTCLGDLTEMLLNGKFANLILAYNSVADIGDDELLTPLQEIINEKARQISNINESINKYIKQISDIETAIGDMTKIKTIAEDISSAIYVLWESLSGNEIKSIIDFTVNTETGIVTKKFSDGTLEEMKFPTNDNENSIILSNLYGNSNIDGYTQQMVNSLVSLPNLLINSNFVINQRGQTEYQNTGTVNIYGVDCWLIGIGANIKATKTSVNSAGITLSKEVTTIAGNYFLTQRVEDYAKLAGKTLTVTVAYKNNTGAFRIQCNDGISYSSNKYSNSSGVATFSFTMSKNPTQLQVRIQDQTTSAMSIEILYAKAEIGSVATAYTPPIYENEIWKCNAIYGEPLPLSNPNLLINSNFAINQREQTRYTGSEICVDCWGKYSNSMVEPVSNGVRFTSTVLSTSSTQFTQLYQLFNIPKDLLVNKTVTLSCSVNDIIYTKTVDLIEEMSYSRALHDVHIPGMGAATIRWSNNSKTFYAAFFDQTAYNPNHNPNIINWVKVEFGSVATPYVLPTLSEELAKCKQCENNNYYNSDISTIFPISSSLASDKKVLSEKVIYDNVILKSQVQNPNILINSNFGINQRGIYTDDTSARFMADRWYKQVTNSASVSFDGEECTITLLSDRASKTPILRQIIEDGYKYVGKSLTFSLDVISTTSTYYISIVYYNADGAYVSESAYGLTATNIGRISVSTNSVPNNTSEIRVTINAYANGLTGDKFVFKHPKLEEGSVATIYVTPIYEEELLKCQTTEADPVQILRDNDLSILRKTSISTIYPISYNIASDEKILSEKAIVGKLVTLSEIYSVALSDGDDLDLMVPSVVGQTILYNCPSVGVSNSLRNNPVQGQAFTMYATLNWSSADKLYRRMTQYIITMDGNIWSRGYGTSLGTESTWTNWKKATTYSNEWVKYTGEDLVDGTYSIQITVNSGYRIELGTLNIGGTGASERTSVGIDVYLNTVSLYYVQRENDGTLKVYSCGIGSTTASQQTNILIYYKSL